MKLTPDLVARCIGTAQGNVSILRLIERFGWEEDSEAVIAESCDSGVLGARCANDFWRHHDYGEAIIAILYAEGLMEGRT